MYEEDYCSPVRSGEFICSINGKIDGRITSLQYSVDRENHGEIAFSTWLDYVKKYDEGSILVAVSCQNSFRKDGFMVFELEKFKRASSCIKNSGEDIEDICEIKYEYSGNLLQDYIPIPASIKKMSKKYFCDAVSRLKEKLGENHVLTQNISERFLLNDKVYVWWMTRNYL